MFLEYYGLDAQPFGVTPDPRYLYFSPTHREALASLFYGIETGCGFMTLITPPGMGKTTLLVHLLERLRGSAQTVFLFQTQCGSREFLRYLLADLGIDASDENLAHMHELLRSVLLNNARTGRRFVLVIDEAQNLDSAVLETVRLLSDFEAPPVKLIQIVLAGQPQLAQKLSHRSLTQLRQRISIVARLRPLTPDETATYISHRLQVSGYSGPPLFNEDAIRQIVTSSEGVPRVINNICFNALTLGYAKDQKQIGASVVSEVLADLEMDFPSMTSVVKGWEPSSIDPAPATPASTAHDEVAAAVRVAWAKDGDRDRHTQLRKKDSFVPSSLGDNEATTTVCRGEMRVPSAAEMLLWKPPPSETPALDPPSTNQSQPTAFTDAQSNEEISTQASLTVVNDQSYQVLLEHVVQPSAIDQAELAAALPALDRLVGLVDPSQVRSVPEPTASFEFSAGVEVASPAEPAFDLVEHSASVTAPQALLVTQATTAAEPLNEGSTIPIDVPADSLPQLPLAKDSASDGADIHGATDSHTVLLKLPSHRGGSSRREKFKVLIEVFAMLFVVGGLTVIHYTSDHILAASAAKVVRGRESRTNPDGPDKPPIEPARDGTTEIPRIPMVLSGDAHIPPNPATKPLFKHFISDTFGRLNGHPYSRAAESKITDEPLLSVNTDAGTAAANYLSGVVPTVGPTPPSPQNALADNASIKSAHILSIVEPQYSKLAVQTGNRGNVIINITISAQGTVTAATVVSGPTLLREEALTAVRLWKYQPAELHGRPIESQTKVAIRFE